MHDPFLEETAYELDSFTSEELVEYKNKYSDVISIISNINNSKPASPVWNDLKDSKLTIDYSNELNPEQLSAVTNINGPLLIVAGAGSEKQEHLSIGSPI